MTTHPTFKFIVQRLLGEEHPDVATSYNNLALLYYSQGRYSEAEPLFQKVLEIAELCLGVNHPNIITFRKHLKLLPDRT
ncbi:MULTISPECIES: tetratricopeptide repeat protein [Nostoc]|uniref:tetratricopeptide repeat protein n=1 Tax=Nostoc TaxID=1177 RepID=UPI0036F31B09